MTKLVQNNFLGGQLDFEMMGRQDVDRYAKGATELKNFIPLKRGALRKRPGTCLRHDLSARIGSGRFRLVPFASSVDDGWTILFTSGAALAMNRTTTVEVAASGAAFFTGDAIGEFDYCQCGDILYLSHQSYPPCRIEHRINGATHTFTLKLMEINVQSEGVPTITGATVSKAGITTKGPTVTEHYRATAVFDGIETFPSPDYSDANCADYDNGYDEWQNYLRDCDNKDKICSREYQPAQKTYSGTSYTSPWTTSQKISLSIAIATRAIDGVVTYPDQIRIYRKTGSYYGIVGILDTSNLNAKSTATVVSGVTSVYRGTNPANNTIADASATCGAFGLGLDGFLVTGALTLSLADAASRVSVKIIPGSVVATETTSTYGESNGESKTHLESITYTFRPCRASRIAVRLGSGVQATVPVASSPADMTLTVARNDTDDDSDDTAIRIRAEAAFANWINSFTDTVSISVEATSPVATQTLTISSDAVSWIATNVGIRAYRESTNMTTFEDKYYTPDVSITPPTEKRVMGGAGEYPACVCLSQQRLIYASTRNNPSRVFMSQIGSFIAFTPHQVETDDDPIDFQISATRFPKVNHIMELRKLLMFNGAAEWVVDSASSSSGITYATIQARQHSSIGAAVTLKPLVCNNVLLFAERTGQAVRQYGYQLEDDGYGGEDISIFSSSIFRDRKIVDWAYQQHPHSTCWCVLSDGALCSLTFVREQNTIAWATHELGGDGKARAIVCTHALTGNVGAVADTSQVFVLVQRGAVWTLEEMRCDCKHGSDTVVNALCLDSMRTLADGEAARAGATVIDPATGAETAAAEGMVEGFRFEALFTSVYPVVKDEIGMAQMDVKCLQEAHLRLADSIGGSVRAVDVPAAQASRLVKTALAVADGTVTLPMADENVPLVTGNTRDGRITVAQDEAWPFTILMMETDLECEEDERSGQ